MLDLVYSGHADVAYQFCERVWPGPEREKAAFLAEFRQRLGQSPFRSAIEALGHPPLPPIDATDP
jgi:hypothetical protein